jgi:hypothetical protein
LLVLGDISLDRNRLPVVFLDGFHDLLCLPLALGKRIIDDNGCPFLGELQSDGAPNAAVRTCDDRYFRF